MDKDIKILLGKILGEIYRIEKRTDTACPAINAHIYGLLNGFEYEIEEELNTIGFISKEQVDVVTDLLDGIWNDAIKLENLKGFYDIENELSQKGVSRAAAMKIFRYLNAENRYEDLIIKIQHSTMSPSELKHLDLDEFDK
jgi:hypothetical protein